MKSHPLTEFAKHTCSKQDETLGKRYLAVHMGAMAYAFLADDYDALVVRTHNPPLSSYTCPDPQTFAQLMQQSTGRERHLKDVLPGKCAVWQDHAATVALQFKSHQSFPKLIAAIAPEGMAIRWTSALVRYKCDNDLESKATELIATLPNMALIIAGDDEDIIGNYIGDDVDTMTTTTTTTTTTLHGPSIEGVRQAMEPFRKRAQLPPTSNPMRIAQQMICSRLGIAAPELLHRNQTSIPKLVEDEHAIVESLLDCVEFQPLLENTVAFEKSELCESIRHAAQKKSWDTRTLLKYAIDPAAHLDARAMERFTRRMYAMNAGNDDVLFVAIKGQIK